MKKVPKTLNITPTKYDIELSTYRPADPGEFPEVTFRFGTTEGRAIFTDQEAERIGRWFLALAKFIREI